MNSVVFLALCLCVSYVASKESVPLVTQNYQMTIDDMLVQQVQKELTASYVYQAYASYFQRADVSLPGIKKFFSDASIEERDHAQSLIDYINKRGGHAQYDKIDLKAVCETVKSFGRSDTSGLNDFEDRRMCICGFVATKTINDNCGPREDWKEGLMAFEDTLLIERYVNVQLLDIHKKADAENDAHLTHILEHEFLEEQVNSINKIAHHITRLRSFEKNNGNNYKLGEYIFDQHLK
ncbi:Yolk ferritin [Biomphalaria pfeifferi]|uniref:Ferritin n=1 Tax=Biomphalaria pfeifferi TaxID=112525 RepID=A0AAD8BTB3_BIOPF|nr:Yolk ferritin [Biomphalaria pfeifferi]